MHKIKFTGSTRSVREIMNLLDGRMEFDVSKKCNGDIYYYEVILYTRQGTKTLKENEYLVLDNNQFQVYSEEEMKEMDL